MVEFLLPSAKIQQRQTRLKINKRIRFNETFKGKDEVHNVTEEDKKVAEDFTEYNFIAGLLTDYQAALIKKRDMIPLLKTVYMFLQPKKMKLIKYQN